MYQCTLSMDALRTRETGIRRSIEGSQEDIENLTNEHREATRRIANPAGSGKETKDWRLEKEEIEKDLERVRSTINDLNQTLEENQMAQNFHNTLQMYSSKKVDDYLGADYLGMNAEEKTDTSKTH